jgi:hypothetical protein
MEERAGKNYGGPGKKLKKLIGWRIVQNLAMNTPVDTSAALSNWRITSTHPASTPRPPYFMGSHGSTRAASASAMLNHARHGIHWSPRNKPLVISNLVDYIGELEAGKSPQAGAGWIWRAVWMGVREGRADFTLGRSVV